MTHIFTLPEALTPVRFSHDEAINSVLRRLAYSVDAEGIVYSSSEDGGLPLGSLEGVSAQIEAYGCLGTVAADGTYGRPDAAACARLDRDLFAGSLAPAA